MLKIVNETGSVCSTKILAPDGTDITAALAVETISLKIGGGDPVVRADLVVGLVHAEVAVGKAAWLTRHPITGDYEAVNRIVFADGVIVEFADGVPRVLPPCSSIVTIDSPATRKFRAPSNPAA